MLSAKETMLAELSSRLSALEQGLTGDTLRLGLVTGKLQDSIRQVRMLPFSTILAGFERMVRDLSRELDKDVVLQVRGAEIELDRKVLEDIRDPLMHLLLNAIDHGIEAGVEREAAGKPRTGTVNLTVEHQGGLLVKIGYETYALPLSTFVKIVTIKESDVHSVEGRQMVSIDNQPVALMRLADVLQRPIPPSEQPDTASVVLVRSGEKTVAFLVDELVDEQEIVVKGLGRQLTRVRNVAGATLLGSGEVVIILNTVDLIRSTQQTANGSAGLTVFSASDGEASYEESIILVVDDSITTRTLEKNILEAAGYQVVTAIDGQEAIGYLQNNSIDLIVSDIQMPRMDGFEFAEAVKTNDAFSDLPLILVTSLESQTDRTRGLEAGADA